MFCRRKLLHVSPGERSTPPHCAYTHSKSPARKAVHRAECTLYWALLVITFVGRMLACNVDGEENGECGPDSKLALHMQMPLVFFDNLMRQGEAEARAFFFGGKERCEQ